MKNKLLFGFSLSEIIITVVIIGVIASITIPSIVANYDEKERYTKVNKIYSMLVNALESSASVGENDYTYYTVVNDSAGMKDFYDKFLKNYLHVMKVCENQTAGCWNRNNTKTMSGSNFRYNHPGISIGEGTMAFVLNDGTFIHLDAYGGADEFKQFFGVTKESTDPGMTIAFDINGDKGPNTIGKDIFAAVFLPTQGIVPAFYEATQSQINSDCSKSGTGFACIQKYLNGEVLEN